MSISSITGFNSNRSKPKTGESLLAGKSQVYDATEEAPPLNFTELISDSSEELADLLSSLGRNSAGRRNNKPDSDVSYPILDENADEKVYTLIKEVAKLRDINKLLGFARQLFQHDCDLMAALREMLLSRQLSELQKQKIREAIADLEKFADRKKMQSGMNIGHLAKRFSESKGDRPLSAAELRNSYLNFLELEVPAGFIYKNWIDLYGYQNRTRLLAFTLSALIADMKAHVPGIHYAEFGPLSAKLSEARLLNTLDQLLNENFAKFPFRSQMRSEQRTLSEEDIVELYIAGLVDADEFKLTLESFSKNFMAFLLLKQRSVVIQALRNVYNSTPDSLFVAEFYQEAIIDHLAGLLRKMLKKEKLTGVWKEHYK